MPDEDAAVRLARELLAHKNGAALLTDALSPPSATRRDPSNPFELRHCALRAAADALESDDTTTVSNGIQFIRKHWNSVGDVCPPEALVEKVSSRVGDREISIASEAALTLGFLLNSRPSKSDLPKWERDGVLPRRTELDQRRIGFVPPSEPGYIDQVSEAQISATVEILEANLDRKKYKRSARWAVGENCAFALGFIAYRRPALVESAVVPLLDVDEPDYRKLGPVVFALSSVGYMRPDLLPPGARRALWEWPNASVVTRRGPYVESVRKKLGRAPEYLAVVGAYSTDLLRDSIERIRPFLYRRDAEYHPRLEDALGMLLHARGAEAGVELKRQLISLASNGSFVYGAAPSLMKILENLSSAHPDTLAPIANAADELYRISVLNNEFYDALSRMLCNIYDFESDLVPETVQTTLQEFLEGEERFSVVREANRLLDRLEDD